VGAELFAVARDVLRHPVDVPLEAVEIEQQGRRRDVVTAHERSL